MNEQDLRSLVEKRLKKDIPDLAWKALCHEYAGTLQNALAGNRDDIEEFIEAVRAGVRLGQAFASQGPVTDGKRDAPVSITLAPGKVEMLRMQALSEALALHAARGPAVRTFRSEVLGNQLLDDDAVQSLYDSPAAAWFPLDDFKRDGVPVIGQVARVLATNAKGSYRRVEVEVGPPEVIWQREISSDEVSSEGSSLLHTKAQIWHGSVLDELFRLAITLSVQYSWSVRAAAHFVLTDSAPTMLPIQATVGPVQRGDVFHRHVVLTAELWVTGDDVKDVYRQAQVELLRLNPERRKAEKGNGLKGGNRPIGGRNLTLFRFVLARLRDEDNPISWNILMHDWNRDQPEEERYHDRRRFRRDFLATEDRLMTPKYAWLPALPGLEPPASAWERRSLDE